GTTYYFTVSTYPSPDCIPNYTFTIDEYDIGSCSTCASAEVIPSGTSFPYTHSGTTCGACNNYSSSDACGSSYMNGEDFVYEYTPSSDINVTVDLTSDATWVGVAVTEGCPDVGTCVGSPATSSGADASGGPYSLSAGTTYYFTVSTYPSPDCIPNYTLTIDDGGSTITGSETCEDAMAVCAEEGGVGVNFGVTENTPTVDAPTGQCSYLKNPTWWYFQIESLGDIEMEIASSCGDVDFACYGPFDNLTCDPSDLTGSGSYTWYDNGNSGTTYTNTDACPVDNLAIPSGNLADAAYSIDGTEILNINPVNVGEYYIVIIGNYANCTGTVDFNQTNIGEPGAGSVNCDIVSDCNITSISSTTACTGSTFSVSGEIFFTDPPADGTLTICEGTVCQTFYPPFSSPTAYTLTNLVADGTQHQLTATFASTTTNCDKISFYNAPTCATVSTCPDYANTVISAAEHCAGQTYYFEVQNTDCSGDIYFDVAGNYGSEFANEITWEVTSNLTSNVVASGGPGVDGADIFTVVGPLNPNIEGQVFTLTVYDSYGDGFNGTGGYIVAEQNGTEISSQITGNFGFEAHIMFMPNIVISPATITVTTPGGDVTQTVANCNDFYVPITINSSYFCTTATVDLPWEIRCNFDNSLLASGTHSMTIYPNTPDNFSDIVTYTFDAASCAWIPSWQNDCDASHLGDVFDITPDPTAPVDACVANNPQTLTMQYNGVLGGQDCCSTAGPDAPITYNYSLDKSDAVVATCPFGGINNSAYLTIPENGVGGNATDLTLTFDMAGYCFFHPLAEPTDFWITIYVDGMIVYDQQFEDPATSASVSLDLTDMPGYNQNSVIEVYVYPNTFSADGYNTTFIPEGDCGTITEGEWTASTFDLSISAIFEQVIGSPISCEYFADVDQPCCNTTVVPDVAETICTGDVFDYSTWQSNVESVNPACVVYSSVTPVAGSVFPDNNFPDGINTTGSQIIQTVSAYAYCDANGSGSVDAGDTYTLLSTYELTIDPEITPTFTQLGPYCVGDTPDALPGISTEGITGTWSPVTISTASAGTATYTFSPAAGECATTATMDITIDPQEIPTFDAVGPYCEGDAIPALPTTSTNGITGSWSPAINNTTTTTYTFTPDAGECATTTNLTITVNPIPTAGITNNTGTTVLNCNNATIDVTATGGTSYAWSGGASTNTAANSLSSAGTYTVTVTDNGCTATESIAITSEPPVTASISTSTDATCYGYSDGSATVTAGGGDGSYSYLWGDGQTTATASNLAANTYTVTVTDGSGCTAEATVNISSPNDLVMAVSYTQLNCFGDCDATASVTANGGTTPYDFDWSNGSTGDNISGLCAGTYTVTVTDANGCTADGTTDPVTSCFEITDILVNSCGGVTEGEQEMVTLQVGSSDLNTADLTINWPNNPWLGVCTDPTFVANVNATITGGGQLIEPVGGVIPAGAEVLIISSTAQDVSALDFTNLDHDVYVVFQCAGNTNGHFANTETDPNDPRPLEIFLGAFCEDSVAYYPYYLDNTDGDAVSFTADGAWTNYNLGCVAPLMSTSEANIIEPDEIITSVSTVDVSCFGSATGEATVTASGGTGTLTYIWSDGQTTATATGLSSGAYSVTVEDENGCQAIENITINEPTELIASATNTAILCNGGTTDITVTASGGTSPYTGTGTFTETAGTYTYTVTDDNGCTDDVSITVSEPTVLTSSITTLVDQNCSTPGEATVEGAGGTSPYTYAWPAGAGGVSGNSASSLMAGSYDVTVTDDNGCEVIETVTIIDVGDIAAASVVNTPLLCHGDNIGAIDVTITNGTPDYTIDWGTGNTITSGTSYTITGLSAGNYDITITDINGCQDITTTTLTEPGLVEISEVAASHVDVDCNGNANGQLEVTTTGGTIPYEYTLDGGTAQSSGLFTGLTAGTYTLVVTDANGCTDNMTIDIIEPASLVISEVIASHVDVDCNGNANGILEVTATGGTITYEYSLDGGTPQSSGLFTGLSGGTYTLEVIDAQGCTDNMSITIDEPTALTASTTALVNQNCSTPGSATVEGANGTSPYTYAWPAGAGGVSGNSASSL
ncbi:MAG: beta strand repeat-containing protein, partial [Bacteroidales bacterium]